MTTERLAGFNAAESETQRETERTQQLADSRTYLGMGATVGIVGAASAVLVGATCPACVVAAPALIGAGIFKRWQAKRRAAP